MALTLIEAAKSALNRGETERAGVIMTYARESDILRVLPFEGIQGNALRYNIEEALPGIGFRGVNEAYTESTGIINPQTEPLVIAGGDLDVDMFILETGGRGRRATEEAAKIKALALTWTLKFIKGDSQTSPKEFDGLQVRITGNQLIAAGNTANGDALSLAKLDELIDSVVNPTHLIMSKAVRRRLSQAARNYQVGGFITWRPDEFGRQVAFYGDLPILIADEDNTGTKILGFTEACPGGGTSTGTSLYVVSLTEQGVKGIENGSIRVRDLGELDTKPCMRTRVEWYNGMAVFHPKGAARLWGVKDAAVVV